MAILSSAPMLQVANLTPSISFYTDLLGFQLDSRIANEWAKLSRDGIPIMLTEQYGEDKQSPPNMTGSIYFFTDSVDGLWEEYKDRVPIAYPIEDFDFGMREFAIYDCNGYMLQFGQEIS